MKKNFLETRRKSLGLSLFQMCEKMEKLTGNKKSPQCLSQWEKFSRYIAIGEIKDIQVAYNMSNEELLEYLELCRQVKNGSENA